MKTAHVISLILVSLSFPALALAADDSPSKKKDAPKKEEAKAKVKKCPICGKEANPKCSVKYEEKIYVFNSGECRDKFNTQRSESLYHKLGGKPAMDAAVDRFYVKVLADERINGFFEDVDMKRQHRKQKAFLSAALGGPEPWKGKDLRRAHKNLDGLKDSHFDAVAENLQATLAELKVKDELIKEVMAVVGSVRDDVLNRKKKDVKADEKKPKKKAAKTGDKAAEK